MIYLSTEQKVFIGIGVATVVIIIGGILLASNQNARLSKPLMGQEIQVSEGHVPDGTKLTLSSNPPAGGEHYGDNTAHAGLYDMSHIPADGYLVHSLEHGAVILWYNPKELADNQISKLKDVFSSIGGKSIMVPRTDLPVPLALSSWGRILKLQTVDSQEIKSFFATNMYRGPEQGPI